MRASTRNFLMPKLSEKEFLKKLYQQFQDEALKADDERYEHLYEEHPDLAKYDHASDIAKAVEFSDVESLHLLSGFRGSGKSTELNRLADKLQGKGYFVLIRDALDYLDPGESIDIVTLLNALAGAFSDALADDEIGNALKESYWKRFTHWLKTTNVSLDEIGIKASTPAKTAEANLKLAFKTAPSFRQQLREKLQSRLGEVKNQVFEFLGDCRALVRSKRGSETSIVFIFDQFEQIPGAPGLSSHQQSLIEDTKRVFADYLNHLRFPGIHMVLTVPSWLKLVLPSLELRLVANLPMWKRDKNHTPRPDSLKVLRSLVARRFDAVESDGVERFFDGIQDDHSHPVLDKLIAASGGHFRDLFRLLRESIIASRSIPISDDVAEQAIHRVRSGFLPIAVQDARALQRISDLQSTAHETSGDADIYQLAQFMNTHRVLYFINGDEWYDIHPLIRAEVKAIVERADLLDRQKKKDAAAAASS